MANLNNEKTGLATSVLPFNIDQQNDLLDINDSVFDDFDLTLPADTASQISINDQKSIIPNVPTESKKEELLLSDTEVDLLLSLWTSGDAKKGQTTETHLKCNKPVSKHTNHNTKWANWIRKPHNSVFSKLKESVNLHAFICITLSLIAVFSLIWFLYFGSNN